MLFYSYCSRLCPPSWLKLLSFLTSISHSSPVTSESSVSFFDRFTQIACRELPFSLWSSLVPLLPLHCTPQLQEVAAAAGNVWQVLLSVRSSARAAAFTKTLLSSLHMLMLACCSGFSLEIPYGIFSDTLNFFLGTKFTCSLYSHFRGLNTLYCNCLFTCLCHLEVSDFP